MDMTQFETKENSYIIVANYPDNSVHFDKDYAKIIGVVDASTPEEAFQEFIDKHANDVYNAQRFHDEVLVMPNNSIQTFSIREHYGDMARNWQFPNYGLLP